MKKIKTTGESLSGKTAKGMFWVFTLRITDRLFKTVRIIILARLLSPDDFGIFGIALLVLSTLEVFSQTGYPQALIQKKGEVKHYLNTAWTVGLIRGFLIATVVFFVSQPAAAFFATPGAGAILRVIGISIVIRSFTNIAVIYFHKELEFQKFFKYRFLGTIADFAVAITAAFFLQSVWALVYGLLAGNLTSCIMSYVIEPYRPKLQFDRNQARELLSFGKWVLGSSILIFFIIKGDDIFVGKLLGAAMLGFYQVAYRISNMPTTEITLVISNVSFPLYSKLQGNLTKLKNAYLKILQLTTFVSFPLAGIIFALAPEFTQLFLGKQWMPIVQPMKVLVLAGLIRSLITTTIPVLRAVGKPKTEAKWQVIRLSVLIILIYPLTIRYGILGTSIAVFISALTTSIGFCIEVIKIVRCGIKNFCKLIILPLINGAIIVLSIYILKVYINAYTVAGFFSLIGISIGILIGINYLFDKYLNYRIQLLIKEGLVSFKVR